MLSADTGNCTVPGAAFAADKCNEQVDNRSNNQDFDQQVVELLEDELPQGGARVGLQLVAPIDAPGLCVRDTSVGGAWRHVPLALGCLSIPA